MTHQPWPLWARLLLFACLVVVAVLALPVAAAAVEAISDVAENWIVVVYVALVVLVAVAIGRFAPRASTATTPAVRMLRWGLAGLLAAVVAYAGWLLVVAG